MGLFDKLLEEGKKMIEEVATEENKEKAVSLFNSVKDTLMDAAESIAQSETTEQTTDETDLYEADPEDTRNCREKILSVLADSFSQYTVRENVSPQTIGGSGRFMDYSIVVYDGEKPKLIMMIIGKTTTSHREYRWSREEAEKNGIVFLNFVEHYPNKTAYIQERLAKYL